MCEVTALYDGYSMLNGENKMSANCSCVLIKGPHNVIVDTMTPWDSPKILTALKSHQIKPDQVNFVVSTHGHSDHIGNNNLFLKAHHIVGFNISFGDNYFMHPFDKGEEYTINDYVKVIPTPGHTLSDVTVYVTSSNLGKVAITGDLFEKAEDIDDPNIWLDAGSEDPVQQMRNRSKIAKMVNWIIPGHGTKFEVTEQIRDSLQRQCTEQARLG